MSQSEVFRNGEGDKWYLRNIKAMSTRDVPFAQDFLFNTLNHKRSDVNSILEVGCSAGHNLELMCNFFEARGFGVDPSQMAIKDAIDRSKDANSEIPFEYEVGTADFLPYVDNLFDLVVFGFCLYLVPREEINKALSEANRVLKSGGFLTIIDFDVPGSLTNTYIHAKNVNSFKQDYSLSFLKDGKYSLISKWSHSHKSDHFVEEVDERISISVLHKELN
jgi:ubiquinone/menaquinone biosynthesis C-methylase UbiE